MKTLKAMNALMIAGRAVLLLLLFLCTAKVALAHPMGNFSVNHYSKITLEKDGISLHYFIDLAEIPTYQELQHYNLTPANSAGISTYLALRSKELQQGLRLSIGGVMMPLHLVSKGVIFPPGAGGLPTMKMGYIFHCPYPASGKSASSELSYTDENYLGHTGWKEVVFTGSPSILLASSAPATDRSSELTNYPTDMLNSPPQLLGATARINLPPVIETRQAGSAVARSIPARRKLATSHAVSVSMAPPAQSSPSTKADSINRRQRAPRPSQPPRTSIASIPPTPIHIEGNRQGTARNAFTELVTRQHLNFWFLFTAALISMGLGALHALEPGHGKTIVAAYLVGSRGTARHALLLGIIVTVAHTASVFALGGITLYASRYILPEQLYPWLGLLSGLTIAMLGGYMLVRRCTGETVDHVHAAGEMHGHWFSSKRRRHAVAPAAVPKTISLTQLFTLGITGGIIPCPAALVVLLSAFALHRLGFGFFLITAFSVGLAAVLISFGLLMVYARRLVTSLAVDGPLTRRWLPIASAAFMTVLGAVIAQRGFASVGFSWLSLSLHSFLQQTLGPALFVAGLGLVLGIRHSTDADHVVAISTIVTRQRSIRGAAVIGTLWGLGHTLTIFVVGCLIILGGVVIPPRIGLTMEFSVGLMLILLGVLNLTGLMQKLVLRLTLARWSSRQATELEHSDTFSQLRSTAVFETTSVSSTQSNALCDAGRLNRLIRRFGAYQLLRPLAIGLVHGLAGSAAVALLVLSTIHKPLWAIGYLVIFGSGTMLGMMGMTAAMSLPLVYGGGRLSHLGRYLGVASGLVSVCFGAFLVYQLGYVNGLFTSQPHWTPQ